MPKKADENKDTKTKTTTKKVATTTKSTAKKSETAVKKSTAKKATTSKAKTTQKKSTTSKAKTTAKKTTKKTSTKKSEAKSKYSSSVNLLEYYDLPYRYNKTVVKMLAQTPKTLFVYWDISDEDRKNYIKQFGDNFFEITKPVLIIHNVTMNYAFEIEINDFANCWYFNVNDEKCEYLVELGRRPKQYTQSIPNDYVFITSSNQIESPNGHILFEKNQKVLYYRNVKTNETYSKDIANLEFIKRLGRIYNLNDLYKTIYRKDEFLNIKNPTSN